MSTPVSTQTVSTQTSQILIPDPAGPVALFPLRPGGPLRFRQLTPAEIADWDDHCRAVRENPYDCEALIWEAA
jgi:hypothetical protein